MDTWLDYGVYVDSNGRRSRQQELQFPTQPLYTATLTISIAPGPPKLLLLAFSAGHIDVLDLQTTEWIQTINLKCTKPLESHGESTLLCLTSASDLPLVVSIAPSGRKDVILKVSGDPNKPFVTSSVSGAQRLIQSAAGAVIDRPVKVATVTLLLLDFYFTLFLRPFLRPHPRRHPLLLFTLSSLS